MPRSRFEWPGAHGIKVYFLRRWPLAHFIKTFHICTNIGLIQLCFLSDLHFKCTFRHSMTDTVLIQLFSVWFTISSIHLGTIWPILCWCTIKLAKTNTGIFVVIWFILLAITSEWNYAQNIHSLCKNLLHCINAVNLEVLLTIFNVIVRLRTISPHCIYDQFLSVYKNLSVVIVIKCAIVARHCHSLIFLNHVSQIIKPKFYTVFVIIPAQHMIPWWSPS